VNFRETETGLLVPDDALSGVCRECGCTDEEPCVSEVPGFGDEPCAEACAWADDAHTLCTRCA